MVPVYRSGRNSLTSAMKRRMINLRLRLLLYFIWHAYGEKCLSVSQVIAVRKEPSNKLIRLVYCFRLVIAIGLAREALRAFNYANHFLDDDTST